MPTNSRKLNKRATANRRAKLFRAGKVTWLDAVKMQFIEDSSGLKIKVCNEGKAMKKLKTI
jgi:hypothetical protein